MLSVYQTHGLLASSHSGEITPARCLCPAVGWQAKPLDEGVSAGEVNAEWGTLRSGVSPHPQDSGKGAIAVQAASLNPHKTNRGHKAGGAGHRGSM